VSLVVYDSLGRVVKRLVEGHLNAGLHAVTWDGADDTGVPVSSGVYVYRLASRGIADTGRMTMVR
jgi:flagellar hook assembly protein FlgD